MNEKMKKQIDGMRYEELLRLWRTAPCGHPMFQGKTGEYFSKVMAEKRNQVGNAAHVAASKKIGW